MPKPLPPRLQALQAEIEGYARGYGLEFFEQVFEVVNYDEMNMVAAYGGFPKRYPHWRFGMEYERLARTYEYGLSRIYELVINNDPCYAYVLDTNADVDTKTVMAHVYGHNDFFRNNFAFQHTNRRMLDEMANHATKVRRLVDRVGLEKVESFIDRCLSLENLIDQHAPYIRRRGPVRDDEEQAPPQEIPRLKVERAYMDAYINPEEYLEAQRERMALEREQEKKFPERPERDVLLFLLEHGPLERWEHELLSMVREEAYYFAPQGQTKILNEGWASFWHSRIMTERAVRDDEIVDYAAAHAGVLSSQGPQLNPYKLGIELLRDVEDRWDRGRFGKEWEECDDMATRRTWDRHLGLGRQKIFEVRRLYNDITFIDTFLTPEFVLQHRLFTFAYDPKHHDWKIVTREFEKVKKKLLGMLTNFGQPIIEVVEGNYRNRGELLLMHRYEGVDVKRDEALDTLVHLQALWRRPVHLWTRSDGEGLLLSFDGSAHAERQADEP